MSDDFIGALEKDTYGMYKIALFKPTVFPDLEHMHRRVGLKRCRICFSASHERRNPRRYAGDPTQSGCDSGVRK
ncbi:hypothetical protein PsorP6_015525 [Peronosclerospora sorghi]|uniref:Uncharacterized protein n=1 Tax=Peronosclerospora sorghi TaxID=230839 RepID=A0ACC0WN91_9STRA|nr:hypothetical protein PsorP6_015525 [Peronosclerospora sorghi]